MAMPMKKASAPKTGPKASASKAAPKPKTAITPPKQGTSSSTSTEVKSPTKTSTVADTKGNITVTGGAGDGNTIVHIGVKPDIMASKASKVRSTTKNKKY